MLVLVEVDDRVATVTLNRPEARNAISADLHRQLDEALTELDVRDDVGCIVLTGADPAFCAGMDLKSLANESCQVQKDRQRDPAQRFRMMPPHDTPVIGAINGPTVTVLSSWRCAATSSLHRIRRPCRHACPGRRHAGRNLRSCLPQLIGIHRAPVRMSFTGDYIDAETARDWGLVVEVVPTHRWWPAPGSWRPPSPPSPRNTWPSSAGATTA